MNSKVELKDANLTNKKMIKSIIILSSYFIYLKFFNVLLTFIKINEVLSNTALYLIADLIYLIFISIIYSQTIKKGINDFLINVIPNLSKILVFVLIIILSQLVSASLISPFLKDGFNSNNELLLMDFPLYFIIFKTIVFSVVTEELIFKTTIYNIIDNKILFLLVSSLLYGFSNILFINSFAQTHLMEIVPYIVTFIITGIMYLKTNNIFLVMLVKLMYNLLPLIVVILGGK